MGADGDGHGTATAVVEINRQAEQVQIDRAEREVKNRAFAGRGAASNALEDGIEQAFQSAVKQVGDPRQQDIQVCAAQRAEYLIQRQALIQKVRDIAQQIAKQPVARHGRHVEADGAGLYDEPQEIEINRAERKIQH